MILSDFVHTTPAILRILFPATEDGVLSSSVPGWWAAGQVSCEPTRISCYQWRGTMETLHLQRAVSNRALLYTELS